MCKFTAIAVLYFDIAASLVNCNVEWNQIDEDSWPDYFCKEGKYQSPIDIQADRAIKDFDRQFIKYGRLKFKGYEHVLVTAVNYGHTIKFSTDGDQAMHPTVTGGPLKFTYHLKEVTLHWLSEHSINGVKYPMEIQLVHLRSHYELPEALNKKHGVAVISVFCNVTKPIENHEKYDTENVMEYLPKLMEAGNRRSGLIIDFRNLLTPSSGSYFTYLGSLTTPQCNEVVVWIIFKTPIHIPVNVYRQFTEASKGQSNFRTLQKIYRHTVFQPAESFVVMPTAVQMLVDSFKTVTDFFKNITSALTKGLRPNHWYDK